MAAPARTLEAAACPCRKHHHPDVLRSRIAGETLSEAEIKFKPRLRFASAQFRGEFLGEMISSNTVSGPLRKSVDDQAPYHVYGAFFL